MLFFLLMLCIVFAGMFLYREYREQYISAVILKGLASVCFVMVGLICSPGTHMAKLIVCGLMTGCLADVLLSLRKVFREKAQLIHLAGILVFLTGHLLYLAAIFPLSSNRLECAVIGIILTVLLMAWIFRRTSLKPAFKVFGFAYIGVITLLNCMAIGNLIAAPSAFTGVFSAGAVLFLIWCYERQVENEKTVYFYTNSLYLDEHFYFICIGVRR